LKYVLERGETLKLLRKMKLQKKIHEMRQSSMETTQSAAVGPIFKFNDVVGQIIDWKVRESKKDKEKKKKGG
jgi:hypothetical protein